MKKKQKQSAVAAAPVPPELLPDFKVIAIPFMRNFIAFAKKIEDTLNGLAPNYAMQRIDLEKYGILIVAHRSGGPSMATLPPELLARLTGGGPTEVAEVSKETAQMLNQLLEVAREKPSEDLHKQAVALLESSRPPLGVDQVRKMQQEVDMFAESHKKTPHPDEVACPINLTTSAFSKACQEFVAARLS
jgi:hypothetical protein